MTRFLNSWRPLWVDWLIYSVLIFTGFAMLRWAIADGIRSAKGK